MRIFPYNVPKCKQYVNSVATSMGQRNVPGYSFFLIENPLWRTGRRITFRLNLSLERSNDQFCFLTELDGWEILLANQYNILANVSYLVTCLLDNEHWRISRLRYQLFFDFIPQVHKVKYIYFVWITEKIHLILLSWLKLHRLSFWSDLITCILKLQHILLKSGWKVRYLTIQRDTEINYRIKKLHINVKNPPWQILSIPLSFFSKQNKK